MQDSALVDMGLAVAIDILREKRRRVVRKKGEVEVESSLASCGDRWFGNENKARPCGCDDKRIFSLCGPKEADTLAKEACELRCK